VKANITHNALLSLNYNEQIGLNGIVQELTDKFQFIKKVILYGSKARVDFVGDSDIDLLFILEREVSRLEKSEMSDIIYDYELANDIVISAIFIPEHEFRDKASIFLAKVRKEGIVIWSRG